MKVCKMKSRVGLLAGSGAKGYSGEFNSREFDIEDEDY